MYNWCPLQNLKRKCNWDRLTCSFTINKSSVNITFQGQRVFLSPRTRGIPQPQQGYTPAMIGEYPTLTARTVLPPPPIPGQLSIATPQAVRLLRSRRRTFLFCFMDLFWLLTLTLTSLFLRCWNQYLGPCRQGDSYISWVFGWVIQSARSADRYTQIQSNVIKRALFGTLGFSSRTSLLEVENREAWLSLLEIGNLSADITMRRLWTYSVGINYSIELSFSTSKND